MDDDGSKTLTLSEFKKGLREMNIHLSEGEMRMLFEHFDSDGGGSIDFEEFIQGVRDPLTSRRLSLVKQAFAKIDIDGNGIVDAQEIATKYDASKHPEVISGKRTPADVLAEFLDTFDVGGVKDGMVTRQEFENYYANLGASIDNEDYFELMIRNAWHISGGQGQAANTSNGRVLVTHSDGSQSVDKIKNDLGLKGNDKEGMMALLNAQPTFTSQIDLKDVTDTTGMKEGTSEFPAQLRRMGQNFYAPEAPAPTRAKVRTTYSTYSTPSTVRTVHTVHAVHTVHTVCHTHFLSLVVPLLASLLPCPVPLSRPTPYTLHPTPYTPHPHTLLPRQPAPSQTTPPKPKPDLPS
jgi:Ca2+-binding EF-hand superfamily protein